MKVEWWFYINPDGLPIFAKLHDSSERTIRRMHSEGWHGPYATLSDCCDLIKGMTD